MSDRIRLAPMTAEHAEAVRHWRNQDMRPWRTPYLLTKEMQEDWYFDTVCDRQANSRHWAVLDEERFVGMVCLSRIEWENGLAEIGLVIDPEESGHGHGTAAVVAVLREAFNNLRLRTVWGECYECNPALAFWRLVCEKYHACMMHLPDRKFHGGRYWGSLWFSFSSHADQADA